jgi:DNA-directed RNA polymerase specialized sigma subunit
MLEGFKDVDKIIKKNKHIVLTNVEQNNMIVKYQETGDVDIRNLVVDSITKTIAKSAFGYSKKTSVNSYSLFVEGYYGALWAADRYDITKNVPFLSYAKLYIKKYQLELIRKEVMDGFGIDHRVQAKLQKEIKEGVSIRHSFYTEVKKDDDVVSIYDTIPSNFESVEDILNEIEQKEIAHRLIREEDNPEMLTSILSEEISMQLYAKKNKVSYISIHEKVSEAKENIKFKLEELDLV